MPEFDNIALGKIAITSGTDKDGKPTLEIGFLNILHDRKWFASTNTYVEDADLSYIIRTKLSKMGVEPNVNHEVFINEIPKERPQDDLPGQFHTYHFINPPTAEQIQTLGNYLQSLSVENMNELSNTFRKSTKGETILVSGAAIRYTDKTGIEWFTPGDKLPSMQLDELAELGKSLSPDHNNAKGPVTLMNDAIKQYYSATASEDKKSAVAALRKQLDLANEDHGATLIKYFSHYTDLADRAAEVFIQDGEDSHNPDKHKEWVSTLKEYQASAMRTVQENIRRGNAR